MLLLVNLFHTGPLTATNGAAAAGPEEIEMTEKAPVTATASTATVQSGPAKGSMMSKQARSFDSCDYFKIKAHSVVQYGL